MSASAARSSFQHLVEADDRHAAGDWGYVSLFFYCTEELGLSEYAAYARIQVARYCKVHPRLLESLRAGEVHLETLRLLGPHLTEANLESVLERAKRQTRREIEKLVAELAPRPDIKEHIQRLPERPAAALGQPKVEPVTAAGGQPSFALQAQPAPARPVDEQIPTSPGRMHYGFNGGEGLSKKLERAKQVLGARSTEEVLEAALDALLDAKDPLRIAARRTALREAEGRGLPEAGARPNSRRIPPAVRDFVWLRDGGQCAIVTKRGRCKRRTALEIDHIVPYALGGRSDDPSNLRLACHRHNQDAAREVFGDALVGPHRRGAKAAVRRPAPAGGATGTGATGPPAPS